MNTKLTKKAKHNFENTFFKPTNDAVFGKTMGNLKKYKGIKLVTTKRRKNYLVSEPNYYTKKFFTENLLVIEIR